MKSSALAAFTWIPSPSSEFSPYVRAFCPKPLVTDRTWTPPAMKRAN